MTAHTALLDLPDALEAAGLNVWTLDGWDEAQGAYYWTDPYTGEQGYYMAPSAYMVHHTAGSAATPVVRDGSGNWSKANAWLGLRRGDRLYQTGGGEPCIALTAAGPARVSSGYGYWPAIHDYAARGIRAPWSAEGPDGDIAGNRYAFNLETVHVGDGGELDPGVWEHVVGLGIVLHELLGWEGEHTLGHVSWTNRKIDPKWAVGLPNDGARCIIDIQDAIAQGHDMNAWEQFVAGIVAGWAEDQTKTRQEFERLYDEGILEGASKQATVDYWVGLLTDPHNPEWLGFVARTTLSAWHRP